MARRVKLERGEILQNRWMVERWLASGGFGSVYVVVDIKSGCRGAVKVESLSVRRGVLKMELGVLSKLRGVTEHACQLLACGRVPNRLKFVVMTLLGRNLYDLQRRIPARRFNGETVARLAIQCVEAIQGLHTIGYVHRDIKPANFAMGQEPGTNRTVHLIDFGLARGYRIAESMAVAPPRTKIGFRGTVRYASVTAHLGQELGRRDDLVSLLYVLVEFRLGGLPWRAIENEKEVGRMKRMIGMAQPLTNGMESAYGEMGQQLLLLRYADEPDYDDFIQLIRDVQEERQYKTEGPFEWE